MLEGTTCYFAHPKILHKCPKCHLESSVIHTEKYRPPFALYTDRTQIFKQNGDPEIKLSGLVGSALYHLRTNVLRQ